MKYLLFYKFIGCYIGISVPGIQFPPSCTHMDMQLSSYPFPWPRQMNISHKKEVFLFDAAKSTWPPWKADQN